jgi:hypothetical protein
MNVHFICGLSAAEPTNFPYGEGTIVEILRRAGYDINYLPVVKVYFLTIRKEKFNR